MSQEFITLNNDIKMPALGLGVFLAKENETKQAVEIALNNGYRLIDTASVYKNELQVGQAVKESGIEREDLFITTKLWITDYGYDAVLKAFDQSLEKLGLDYLDLYLLHFPTPSNFKNTLESWKAMEFLHKKGLIKSIGVCNFKESHLNELLQIATVNPVLNQIELHPYFSQPELNKVNSKLDIVTQTWSPIGGAFIYHPEDREFPHILEHPQIKKLAEAYNKTPAQIVIKWHLQHGRSVIPKSVRENRIKENFNVFDFTLSSEDLKLIDGLNAALRVGPDPDEYDLEYINANAQK